MAQAERKNPFSFFGNVNFSEMFDLENLFKNSILFLTFGISLALIMILVPLPAALLDFFMMCNFIISFVIILTVINSKTALEFSTFPIALLFATAFRLVVNISSTRLILSKGVDFDGQIVTAFADFVTGGSFLIGIVIFIIILTVQFFVITRGASRASEVSARFKLDALPGKQMAIDADLNAGLIDEKTALKRRETIQREADFFGSMDGAGKFVTGEVIASLIIIFVNILGGIIIGTIIRGESLGLATDSYVRFAVGDGLVASIPSLLTAISSGIIVTRNISEKNLADEIAGEFFTSARTYYVTSFFVFAIALVPGFPKLVLIPISLALAYFAYRLDRLKETEEIETKTNLQKKESEMSKEELTPEKIVEGIQVDPLEIELGYELIVLADQSKNGDLLERVKKCRRQLALELGLVIPRVRIADNMQLDRNQYQIKMNGSVLASSKLNVGSYMAIDSAKNTVVEGKQAFKEPVFGLNAYWISSKEKVAMEKKGFTVVDCSTVIATHLTEQMKKHSAEVLGRKETQAILDVVKKSNAPLIGELQALNIKVSDVQRVLKSLLLERVSIRNVQSIIEAMCDAKNNDVKSPQAVLDFIRLSLKRQISASVCDDANNLNAMVFSTDFEAELFGSLKEAGDVRFLSLNPEKISELYSKLSGALKKMEEKGYKGLLVTDAMLRSSLRQLLGHRYPDLTILAMDEIAEGYYLNIIEKV